ncbi:DNA cytosine methyltransferase, partial [Tamilnaduibacter salinus]|uniref:DNA cytosine methyltransferase n=1 Tax=Tamilnaduibacter salinus TaxID=1484056 RepID=UPI001D173E7E
GEGFSSFSCSGRRPFKLAASVEREKSAHKTLTLRAFFRQFDEAPNEYYEYVRAGNPKLREELFGQYKRESEAARTETLGGPKALGEADHDEIIRRVKGAVQGHQGAKVVIGGPPCQAYSVVGRARNKGKDGYTPETDNRHFLYREYLSILDEVRPEIFVMENVRGILSAKVHGSLIFDSILGDLKNPGKVVGDDNGSEYEILSLVAPLPDADALGHRSYPSSSDYLIKAEEFGIPQTRHRVILLGVRRDVLKTRTQKFWHGMMDMLP